MSNVTTLPTELVRLHDENEALRAENEALKNENEALIAEAARATASRDQLMHGLKVLADARENGSQLAHFADIHSPRKSLRSRSLS